MEAGEARRRGRIEVGLELVAQQLAVDRDIPPQPREPLQDLRVLWRTIGAELRRFHADVIRQGPAVAKLHRGAHMGKAGGAGSASGGTHQGEALPGELVVVVIEPVFGCAGHGAVILRTPHDKALRPQDVRADRPDSVMARVVLVIRIEGEGGDAQVKEARLRAGRLRRSEDVVHQMGGMRLVAQTADDTKNAHVGVVLSCLTGCAEDTRCRLPGPVGGGEPEGAIGSGGREVGVARIEDEAVQALRRDGSIEPIASLEIAAQLRFICESLGRSSCWSRHAGFQSPSEPDTPLVLHEQNEPIAPDIEYGADQRSQQRVVGKGSQLRDLLECPGRIDTGGIASHG